MNSISFWPKQTILMAYGKPTGVKACQVSSLAALCAVHAKASMEAIM